MQAATHSKAKTKRAAVPKKKANGAAKQPHAATRVVFLVKDQLSHYYFFGMLLHRVREFLERYPDTEIDPDFMLDWIRRDYDEPEPSILLGVAEQEGKVVGHLVVAKLYNQFLKKNYLHVFQYELDPGGKLSPDLKKATLEQVCEWGRMKGAEFIRLETGENALAAMYQSEYGFEPVRMIMGRDL